MQQLKTDVAKLSKIAEEVEAYIKAELARECDDCVKAINGQRPPWPPRNPKIDPELLARGRADPSSIARG
jgi:hypothetical protein